MKLLIVESPGKVGKIENLLGSGYKVMASYGHVRDLPSKEMGVNFDSWTPHYVPTARGKDILAKLKAAAADAEEVYLATDPDREGEAIAWHLAEALGIKNAKRVTYSEITERAIKTALENARPIDSNLVDAQQGRRILDRLVGYQVSPALMRRLGGIQSAGRVQSPTLRLVVDRDRAVKDFKSTTHYGVELTFEEVEGVTNGWKALWVVKPWLEDGQEYFLDKSVADQVAKQRVLEVVECQESESGLPPPAPFTTSSLQQAAGNVLKLKPKRTMELAQSLFDSGHITYMRTDSKNLSDEAFEDIRGFCLENDLPLVSQKRVWKNKASAQEAHEAIRPCHVEQEEAGKHGDEKALYRLIRLRTLGSQLEDAVYSVCTVQLQGAQVNGKDTLFLATGRTMISAGWKTLLDLDQTEDGAEAEADNPVPALRPGSKMSACGSKVLVKKTKPPKRYTEHSLVHEMERRGIGRPATFASILDNIIVTRGYIKVDAKGLLTPTPEGEAIVDSLNEEFSFMDYEFTKLLEDSLDDIAEGKAKYVPLMQAAQAQLEEEMDRFAGKVKNCEDCGSGLRRLKGDGKNGKPYDFWGCGNRECHATYFNDHGKPGEKQPPREEKAKPVLSEHKCSKCGAPLIHRQGPKKDGSGDYNLWGCSGYPKCEASYPDDGGKPGEWKKK